MADQPSNFISFGDWFDANGAQQREDDEAAFAAAQEQENAAQAALSRASTDARGQGTDLERVASYQDYVKAAKEAKAGYAKLQYARNSANPLEASLRGAASGDIYDAAKGAFDDTASQANAASGARQADNQYQQVSKQQRRDDTDRIERQDMQRQQWADEDAAYETEHAGYTRDMNTLGGGFYDKYKDSGDPFIPLEQKRKQQLANRQTVPQE